jgi:hypothetical protein
MIDSIKSNGEYKILPFIVGGKYVWGQTYKMFNHNSFFLHSGLESDFLDRLSEKYSIRIYYRKFFTVFDKNDIRVISIPHNIINNVIKHNYQKLFDLSNNIGIGLKTDKSMLDAYLIQDDIFFKDELGWQKRIIELNAYEYLKNTFNIINHRNRIKRHFGVDYVGEYLQEKRNEKISDILE